MGFIDTVRNDLVRLRRSYGVSQREVAEIVGVSRTAVSAFETGSSSTMRLHALDRIISLVDQWRSFELPPADFANAVPPAVRGPGADGGEVACPKCKEAVPGPEREAWFCVKCGAALAARCGQCGHAVVDAKARFCGHCGTSLKEGVPLDNASEEGDLPEEFLDHEDDLVGTPLAEELAERVAAWNREGPGKIVDAAK